MPVTIRLAHPSDADAIHQLTLDAYMADRDRLHPPSGVFKETVEDVRRAIEQDGVYVAEIDRAMVGTARVRPDEVDTSAMYCGRVAVSPSEQRRGIGTALMKCVERHARESGFDAVTLGVRIELPENMRFYLKRGYRIVREEAHPGHATPTFVWMRKDL